MSTAQDTANQYTNFEFTAFHFAKFAALAIGFLLLANLTALLMEHGLGHPEIWGLVPLFHFDREQNLPTFFSALMLLFSAALLLAAAHQARETGGKFLPWALLALVFAFLSIDEFASIHEKLDALIKFYVPTDGVLHYAWVAPYGVVVAALAVALGPWFFRLERKLQTLFFVSGALFVGGALGVEIIGGVYYSSIADGEVTTTLLGDLLASIEELGEMSGVAVFIYALLNHVSGKHDKIRLQFA